MKKFLIITAAAIVITSCVQSDKSNDAKMSATIASDVIKVSYDSAYVEVCDTAHKAVPYDSIYIYLKDTVILQKRKHGPGYKSVHELIPATGHAIAYWDSVYLDNCRIDTLKGIRDSILQTLPNFYGVWGNDDNFNQKRIDALKPGIKGWNIRTAWKGFNAIEGKYDWTAFDENIELLKANNLPFGFMIYVGDNSPDWIYKYVPRVLTKDGRVTDTFPYYMSDQYQQFVKKMLKDVNDHMAAKGYDTLAVYWNIAEGSTGDEGSATQGYKGTLVDSKYTITSTWWTNYRRDLWLYMKSITKIQLMVNPGNSDRFGDLAFALQNIPDVFIKSGNSTHQFTKDEEKTQVLRNLQFISNDNTNRIRGEFENVDVQDSSYNNACFTQQVFFALASNVDWLDIAPSRAGYAASFPYFNLFAGKRNAAATTYSFSYSSAAKETTTSTASKGFWWDDQGHNVLTGNYERHMHFTGKSDSIARVSTGTFGRYVRIYIDGTFTLDTKLLQPSEIDVLYLDKTGTININGTTITGKGTGQQLSAVIPLKARSFKITTTSIPVFLVYTK